MSHNYSWAHNKVKLQQSVEALEKRKQLDPSIKVTEESVREEYEKRGGLIIEKTAAQKKARAEKNKEEDKNEESDEGKEE